VTANASVSRRISKVVEPKRKKLAEAEAKLEAANSQLKAKQDALAAVVQRVSALKQQLTDAESEQRQLSAQVGLMHVQY
jgi:dynein heavy chain